MSGISQTQTMVYDGHSTLNADVLNSAAGANQTIVEKMKLLYPFAFPAPGYPVMMPPSDPAARNLYMSYSGMNGFKAVAPSSYPTVPENGHCESVQIIPFKFIGHQGGPSISPIQIPAVREVPLTTASLFNLSHNEVCRQFL